MQTRAEQHHICVWARARVCVCVCVCVCVSHIFTHLQ